MRVTVKTLDQTLPREYVKTVAVARGVSQAELDALELALDGYSTAEISKVLDLSAIAVRKRLGEVYRKFNIIGAGPGKLAELKHRLTLDFQAIDPTPFIQVDLDQYSSQVHWGEAPDIPKLLGRTQESEQLQQWLVSDHTRLITILGMRKIGKTALAVKLVQRIRRDFNVVIWRSLRHSPPLDELLTDLIQNLPVSQTIPATTIKRILYLIECCRKFRCLVVLDDIETLFKKGQLAGTYREGYELYGELLRLVGELPHLSSFMVLSQEEPLEITLQAGMAQAVRVLRLQGLSETSAKELICEIGPSINIQSEAVSQLVQHSGGNPLLLRLVTQKAQELFEGDLEQFYLYYQLLSGKYDELAWMGEFLHLVFGQEFERLSPEEYQMLNSLALLPEKASPRQLTQIQGVGDPTKILKIWSSLQRRSFLKKISESGKIYYVINSIVRQYIKQHIKEKIYQLLQENTQQPQDSSAILAVFGLPKLEAQAGENRESELYQQIGRFLSQIGYQQYMKGEFVSAKTFLTWAIEFHPTLATAHFNLGATYEKLEDLETAEIHYQRAIKSPQKARYSAFNNLARLLIKKGNPQAAIELIEPILSEVSDSIVLASLYKNLGWAYFQISLYSQAEKSLLKALNCDEMCVAAYYLLAQVKSTQGKTQDALEYWQKGLNSPVGKAGLTEPWKWPEIENWELEARRQLQSKSRD